MKNNKKIIESLKSEDNNKILKTLGDLRDKGNFTYFPFIMDIYKNNKNEDVRNSIYEILSNLNDNENTKHLINYIQKENYASIKKDLLTVCWDSRLDFSPHLTFFVDLFISDSFEIAFDAFTVIENIEKPPAPKGSYSKIIETEILKLKENLTSVSKDKKELLVTLVKVLEGKR